MKRRPDIIEAIKNRKLFGSLPRFKSLETWTAWLVVLKAIFGLPMTLDDLLIFNRHTGRSSPPLGGSKENFLVVGRRGGKSFISALVGVFIGCFFSFGEYLTTGERGTVLILAVDKAQAKVVFNYCKGIIEAIPALRSMVTAWRADEVELSNDITIAVKTSDYRSVRGVTIVCCICDEVAFWDSQGVNPDTAVFSALRPAMATIPIAKLICISTGYAQVGVLYDMHKKYHGREDDEILVWQADTATMNPTISQTFIDREIEKDPEAGRAEWLGLFREDVSAAFPLEAIEACIVPGRDEFLAAPEHFIYFGFADPSGGRHDSFTLAIAHHDGGKVVLDAIRAIKPPFDPGEVTREFSDFLKLYGINGIFGDSYGGEWPVAEFAKHGILYALSEKTKSELYLSLIPVLTSKRVELLANEGLKNELRRLERRRGRSGKDSIDHPPRGTDDIANAVAGVIYIASEHAGQFVIPEAFGERKLSRMFVLGIRAGRVAFKPYIGKLKLNNTRKGFFEWEQFHPVWSRLSEDLQAAIEVAYITGWRIHDEIFTRRKDHADLKGRGWLRLDPGETKNGEGRMFPMTSRLREIIEKQLERTKALEKATGRIIPWLFHRDGRPIKSFHRAWLTACKRAGVPGKVPHDFRRTAVRNLERAGVPRSSAMKMVGHKTEAIYRRYAIAEEKMLGEAADKLEIFQAADQKETNGKVLAK
jgi:integrase